MFANNRTTWRRFSVPLATLSLVALSLSGCGWAENYAKPIHVNRMKLAHSETVGKLSESFFTADEMKVAFEQLARIQTAFLEKIETKPGVAGAWSYQAVTEDRLLIVAQVRALRDEYLPPSGLSNEEQKQGVKTCNEAICALVANKFPLDYGKAQFGWGPQVPLQAFLRHLREVASAKGGEIEKTSAAEGEIEEAAPTPPAEREVRPIRPVKVVDPDKSVRQALALLEEALAHAREKSNFEIPAEPCQIDLAVEIQTSVDEYLKKLDAN